MIDILSLLPHGVDQKSIGRALARCDLPNLLSPLVQQDQFTIINVSYYLSQPAILPISSFLPAGSEEYIEEWPLQRRNFTSGFNSVPTYTNRFIRYESEIPLGVAGSASRSSRSELSLVTDAKAKVCNVLTAINRSEDRGLSIKSLGLNLTSLRLSHQPDKILFGVGIDMNGSSTGSNPVDLVTFQPLLNILPLAVATFLSEYSW